MNRTQKTLTAFALAAAVLANTPARAVDQSTFFDCAREITDGAVTPCPAPNARRPGAPLERGAEFETTREAPIMIASTANVKLPANRRAVPAPRPINGAVLADGVTIDGGN